MSGANNYGWWQQASIEKKLKIGIVVFSVVVMLIFTLLLGWASGAYFHQKMKRDITMLATVLSDNVRAAVTFKDKPSADKILQSIAYNDNIDRAAIYVEGKLFTHYARNDELGVINVTDQSQGVIQHDGRYLVNMSILVTGREAGRLLLESNMQEWKQFRSQLYILMFSLFSSFLLLAAIMSIGLKQYITKPLSALSDWAVQVSKQKSFDELAVKTTDDEIGKLVDALNNMLNELAKQESIVSLNERLTYEIHERKKVEKNLIEMNRVAQEAGEAKTRFLANMSHEIRTPMNAIMGFVDIVLESDLSDEYKKHLRTVKRSAKLLHGLLNDILDIAKLEQGKLRLEFIAFSVSQVINDVVSTFEAMAEVKKIYLTASVDDCVHDQVVGDPLRLNQILVNLVGNAIKFTNQGKVEIVVLPQEGNKLLFKVVDTGVGLKADQIEHIFQNFAQADSSISRRYGGSGLGTTISKQLVELMGGAIWVESELGEGSTFFFILPLEPSRQLPAKVPEPELSAKLEVARELRILVAEDVQENFDLVKIRLQAQGHKVSRACDGLAAVESVRQNEFDIVLMDIQMPKMDGIAATKAIRELPGTEFLPIIALTASVLRQNKLLCVEAGVNGFVTKPIIFKELYGEMNRLLGVGDQPGLLSDNMAPVNVNAIRLPGINYVKAISLWRKEDIFFKNLASFVTSNQNTVSALREHVEENNLEKARETVHALVGVSGNLALDDIYARSVSILEALRNAEIDKVRALIPDLERDIKQINATLLDRERSKSDDGFSVISDDFNDQQFMDWVGDLIEIFERGRTADDLQEKVLMCLRHRGMSAKLIRQLEQSVEGFELSEAAQQLRGIKDNFARLV